MMKKHFVLTALFALSCMVGIQAQNINKYLVSLDDLKAPVEQQAYTFINSVGQVMFDGEILQPEALYQPIEKKMQRQDPCYFIVISALPKDNEVFQQVIKQHIDVAKALNKKSFKVYYSTELPPPPFPPQINIVEVIEDEPQEEVPDVVYSESDDLFIVCENMPEFPGGQQAMLNYLKQHIVYPEDARQQGVQGRTIVQFVVEKDGSIANIEVVRTSGNKSLDKEAFRVVKSMPKWKPGSQRGKIVRVRYTLPVSFKLNDIVPVDGESISMEYDAQKWSMEPGTDPDAYLFTYKPFDEYVSIQFFKGDTMDAKQYIQNYVIGKKDSYFQEATVTDQIGESVLFGSPVFFTIYLSPWGDSTYKGVAMTMNTHGGFLYILTASSNYAESEYLQLVKTIRFKQE